MKNLQKVVYLSFKKSYLEAAILAFDLDIRRELTKNLKIMVEQTDYINEMIFNEESYKESKRPMSIKCEKLDQFIDHAIENDLKRLLLLIRDLNANARNSNIA